MRSPSGPALIRLLHAAGQDRADLSLGDFSANEIRWAVATGLGPWLLRCTARDPEAKASSLWPLVHGADLTARMIVADQLDTLEEIVVECEGHVPPLTLLKGISVCERYYPAPHLRAMGDLDILVDPGDVAAVESRLLGLGYRRDSPLEDWAMSHHTAPLIHPDRRVWVEIHHRLMPPTSHIGADPAFDLDTVAAARRPSTFRGRPVHHLSPDMELVYFATHWGYWLRPTRAMFGVLDVIRLLGAEPTLSWEAVFGRLRGSVAAMHVYLLLSYLHRRGLARIEGDLLRDLFRYQTVLGRINLATLHVLVDQYVIGGRPFGPIVSRQRFDTIWTTLVVPRRPALNLLATVLKLLPLVPRLVRRLLGRA
jgi:hypothetical protein